MFNCRTIFNEVASVTIGLVAANAVGKLAAGTATTLLAAGGLLPMFAGVAFVAAGLGIYYGAKIGYCGTKAVLGSAPTIKPSSREASSSQTARALRA